jgi:predicted ester cyclase
MTAKENEQAVLRMAEAFNTGDSTIVDELVDHDLHNNTPLPGISPDRLGLKLKIQHLRRAYPDAVFTIEKMRSDGDQVTFHWKLEGTHKGTFIDEQPTNDHIVVRGQDVVKFSDGKMIEHHSLQKKDDLVHAMELPEE